MLCFVINSKHEITGINFNLLSFLSFTHACMEHLRLLSNKIDYFKELK